MSTFCLPRPARSVHRQIRNEDEKQPAWKLSREDAKSAEKYHEKQEIYALLRVLCASAREMRVFLLCQLFLNLSPSGSCVGMAPVTKIIVNILQIIVDLMNNYAIVWSD
jgi:hypothetical protein